MVLAETLVAAPSAAGHAGHDPPVHVPEHRPGQDVGQGGLEEEEVLVEGDGGQLLVRRRGSGRR